jgi:histidyl-tRNA synthetase
MRLIKMLEKSTKKEGLVEFEKLAEGYGFQKKKQPVQEEAPLTKKTYLEHKENKLKKIKDKSKQSLGTMGSR